MQPTPAFRLDSCWGHGRQSGEVPTTVVRRGAHGTTGKDEERFHQELRDQSALGLESNARAASSQPLGSGEGKTASTNHPRWLLQKPSSVLDFRRETRPSRCSSCPCAMIFLKCRVSPCIDNRPSARHRRRSYQQVPGL